MDIQNQSTKPTPSELLEIFPEAVPIIKRNLRELKAHREWLEPELLEGLRGWIRVIMKIPKEELLLPTAGHEWHIESIKLLVYDHYINPLDGHIKRLSHLLKIHEWQRKPSSDNTITDLDIAHAKEFRITEFITPNRSGFISCLWHQEKSASCKIHKDNRYHCYGCGADGDVIDLVMKLFGLDFINAVKKILNK